MNKWTPALISASSGKIKVWNPDEYPDSGYENDKIDCIHVFVIENKNYVTMHTMLKPKNKVMSKKSDYFG
jgi:hypothetical protein